MGRWRAALAVVLLVCAAILALHNRSPHLLQDTDTRVLLARLQERNSPLSWFTTDWPLQNHFYRPISTLSFELDRALFGNSPGGYALSAALYCALCVLGVFWLGRELTDRPWVSAGAATLFGLWHSPLTVFWEDVLGALAVMMLLAGLARHRASVRYYLPAVLALLYLGLELNGVHSREAPAGFYRGVLAWLPARTAALATLFTMVACALAARWVRLRRDCEPKEPKATDPPATRSSKQSVATMPSPWLLACAGFAVLLALGSHEQAVTAIPLLLVVLLLDRRLRGRSAWGMYAGGAVALVGYLLLHSAVVPPEPSAYQEQQLRTGSTVWLSLTNYVFPAGPPLALWWTGIGGLAILATAAFYVFPLRAAGNLVSQLALDGDRVGWAMLSASAIAFAPMAMLKPFPHYHYMPMAFRSLFAAIMVCVVWKLMVTAVSPPALQAPPRPAPAPGSLPRL